MWKDDTLSSPAQPPGAGCLLVCTVLLSLPSSVLSAIKRGVRSQMSTCWIEARPQNMRANAWAVEDWEGSSALDNINLYLDFYVSLSPFWCLINCVQCNPAYPARWAFRSALCTHFYRLSRSACCLLWVLGAGLLSRWKCVHSTNCFLDIISFIKATKQTNQRTGLHEEETNDFSFNIWPNQILHSCGEMWHDGQNST